MRLQVRSVFAFALVLSCMALTVSISYANPGLEKKGKFLARLTSTKVDGAILLTTGTTSDTIDVVKLNDYTRLTWGANDSVTVTIANTSIATWSAIGKVKGKLTGVAAGSTTAIIRQYTSGVLNYTTAPINIRIRGVNDPLISTLHVVGVIDSFPSRFGEMNVEVGSNNGVLVRPVNITKNGNLHLMYIDSFPALRDSFPTLVDSFPTLRDSFPQIASRVYQDITPTRKAVFKGTVSSPITLTPEQVVTCYDVNTEDTLSGYYRIVSGSDTVFSSSAFAVSTHDCCSGATRGNFDGDATDEVGVLDLTAMVDYLYFGGPAASCLLEADVVVDGSIDAVDLARLVDYLYGSFDPIANCPAP